MIFKGLLLVFLHIGFVSADYFCACSYDVEKKVYSAMSDQVAPLGYMYEFDCKQELNPDNLASGWIAVAFQHKIGYIQDGPQMQKQTCAGDPPTDDSIKTTKKPTTAQTTSTQTTLSTAQPTPEPVTTTTHTKPTTVITTPQPTIETTTPQPTTVPSTSQPTTVTSTPQLTIVTTTPPPTTTQQPTTVTTTPQPTTATTSTQQTTVTTTPQPTTVTSTPQPTIVKTTPQPTTTQQPTTVTTTPQPTTATTSTQQTTVTTTPQPTTVTTTPQPTTVTTTHQTTTRTSAATTLIPTTAPPRTTTPPQTGTTKLVTGHLELCPSQVVHAAYIGHGFVAQYDTSCYEVVPSFVSWFHAEANCTNSGGHLVTINSAMEQTFLYNFLHTYYNKTVWIGLNDRQHEENFTWVSGEPVSYTNWVPDRKSINHNFEDCVFMVPTQSLQGKWKDIRCGGNGGTSKYYGEKHRYICEYHIDSTMTTLAPVQPGSHVTDGNAMLCPLSIRRHAEQYGGMLAQYKEHCYELLPRHAYSWTHGEQVCEAQHGRLAHISDADEQDFIQQFMKRHYPDRAVWIGLTDRGHEGTYTWTSGVPVQYTNWTPDHVGNFADPSREDCVAFIPYQNGEWDDIPCGSTAFLGATGERHVILCQYRTDIAGSIIG